MFSPFGPVEKKQTVDKDTNQVITESTARRTYKLDIVLHLDAEGDLPNGPYATGDLLEAQHVPPESVFVVHLEAKANVVAVLEKLLQYGWDHRKSPVVPAAFRATPNPNVTFTKAVEKVNSMTFRGGPLAVNTLGEAGAKTGDILTVEYTLKSVVRRVTAPCSCVML